MRTQDELKPKWFFGPHKVDTSGRFVVSADLDSVAILADTKIGGCLEEQQQANARLFAKAAELYAYSCQVTQLIHKAGLHQLARGVELGSISWEIKMTEALERLERAQAEALNGENANG